MDVKTLLAEMPPEIAEKMTHLEPGTGTCCTQQGYSEYLEQKKNFENSAPGHLIGADCPICKNRGYVTEVRGNYLVSVECKCMERRRSIRQIEKSGMKNLLDRHTLENFETKERWQAGMKQKALDFLADNSGGWFAALGSVGGGKTHICTAICGELLNRGIGVRYMLWRDESTRIKAVANDAGEYDRLISPFKRAKVLYIDDLFKTRRGEEIRAADINLAFEILNYRYCDKKLVTVISSEKTMGELMKIDEAIGSRVYERCKNWCVELLGNKNRRVI